MLKRSREPTERHKIVNAASATLFKFPSPEDRFPAPWILGGFLHVDPHQSLLLPARLQPSSAAELRSHIHSAGLPFSINQTHNPAQVYWISVLCLDYILGFLGLMF
ncbi:hypothetical protein CHARACLAT_018047 [Characodon lateralis]|uniref:Uncharacterized protein n=1 Tax=Characodon lateralis TaxID=208331 RepID=A0ABU7CRH4_9TELE|nr:hypothetical protein [Characodon lateralis]